jgi:hypothetical protein
MAPWVWVLIAIGVVIVLFALLRRPGRTGRPVVVRRPRRRARWR